MKNWTLLMWVYLFLAIAGLIVPWYFNLQFISEEGGEFPIRDFVAQGFATSGAASLTSDLLIGASAVTIWMIVECRRLKMKGLWLYLVFTYLIAFAFACPLFLLMRERKLKLPPKPQS